MLNSLEQINNLANASQTRQNQPTVEELRKTAMQFEAILLQQLTSALNSTSDGDEDSLFGGDGGTGLAKQMFSEQLAKTMAESGGVGLSDLIMRQFGVKETKPAKTNNLVNMNAVMKEIRQNKTNAPLINKAAKFEPVSMNSNSSNEVEIISTFEDEIKTEGIDDSLKNLILDGKIVNSTRPRIVPNAPVNQVSTTPIKAEIPAFDSSIKVKFQLPANGRISSEFGSRFHPIDKRMKFHGGIDIAIPTGTQVKAAADGIVKFAGWRGGYGNTVIVQHADGSETLYAHNSKLLVEEGQKVTGGMPISLSGSTGKSTGPHLHFELRRDGELVNPAKFLSNVLANPAER